ncbi:DUF305 domain-containing protein [Nocardioides lijunqiniae]|uniref:DUF305 domain-containing protein n=1 Tax=Nocardioides lijunqiniae TaxID=2760832 RepID=UPI0018781A0F|nr:DUF305 domain-containing protein [Nocardioides lijunqiniae]
MTSSTSRSVLALLLAGALALTACGGSDAESDESGAGARDQDVAFASDMIQHHAQALVLVDHTVGRELSPEVADLAEGIREAQAPEIETMTDWLLAWGEEVPATVRDHVNAEGHGKGHASEGGDDVGEQMSGMVGAEELAALEAAPDAEFGARWLRLMVEHHEGAVAMAEEQVRDGDDADAVALAQRVVAGQGAEIRQMEALLDAAG